MSREPPSADPMASVRAAVDAINGRLRSSGRLVALTGAGVSAESGIPTFRGPGGFWQVGSAFYTPEEMATFAMFDRDPAAVWQWYLYRIGLCRDAAPNAGHFAVRQMEERLGDRFLLITQNVDGLHLRAGSSAARTYQIHGQIECVRCSRECTDAIYPLPPVVRERSADTPLSGRDREALRCPACSAWLRPHVLWFDECYDERRYRFESAIGAASAADVLMTVGTSGATNLPMQVGAIAAARGALLVDVNPDPNPFAEMAERRYGFFLRGPSGTILPALASGLR